MIGAFLWGVLTGIPVTFLLSAASLPWSLRFIQRRVQARLVRDLTRIVTGSGDEQG